MTAKFFGQFLLERGKVNREELLVAVELQKHVNVKLGTLAIDQGFMTLQDVERVNQLQRTVDKRFGELAVENGLLTETQVAELLAAQKQDRLFLGEALVKKGFMTLEELAGELEAFKKDQEKIPSTIAEIYTDRPNAEILGILADVVTKLFLRIADETVKAGPCLEGASDARLHDFTIHQKFTGDFEGMFCLNLTSDILKRIAGRMLSEEVSEVGEDAMDGGGEFVNIICGNICAKLSAIGKVSEIQPPIVHDNGKEPPFDLVEISSGARLTVTPLLHPESGIEICVIDRSA